MDAADQERWWCERGGGVVMVAMVMAVMGINGDGGK